MLSKKVVLTFPQPLLDKAIVYRLIKDYNLIFNILQARITPDEEGVMILEIRGKREDYKAGVDYLRETGVKVRPLNESIFWRESECTHCGLCTDVCPTQALTLERPEMRVRFEKKRCIACELCISLCPVRAIERRVNKKRKSDEDI
ncbi:MAG: (Fe-S)-binding protein [Candidatus Omnitrophota bacterium]|nr:MAG: (Fe-S)-binding protein [Candidatus Omnitrophota bacterium]